MLLEKTLNKTGLKNNKYFVNIQITTIGLILPQSCRKIWRNKKNQKKRGIKPSKVFSKKK